MEKKVEHFFKSNILFQNRRGMLTQKKEYVPLSFR
jgi:hypothetical protein